MLVCTDGISCSRHGISSRAIPEDSLLETDSDISSESDELNLTQDYLGLSWRSGITSGISSRRVVINETPQPLAPAHRVLYSSGHHSPPRSILRTPSVKTPRRVHHSDGANQRGKAKQVDILRIESNCQIQDLTILLENQFRIHSLNIIHPLWKLFHSNLSHLHIYNSC